MRMPLNIQMTSHISSSMQARHPRVLLWNNKILKNILCKSLEGLSEWFSLLSVGRDSQSAPLESASACIDWLHTCTAYGWTLYVHHERPRTRQGNGLAQRQSATDNEHGGLDYFF